MKKYTKWTGEMLRISGTDYYTATKELVWEIGKVGSGLKITVPSYFKHDVSVPKFLTIFQDKNDPQVQKFARLHDWMLDQGWSRVEAGAIAHEALVADGVNKWKRLKLLLAVILFKYR